jgi:DNA-binding PadR family transcriptional regulator
MMRNSYPAGGFGGPNIDGMWQAVEEFRSRFEKRSGARAGRGEVRSAILALLAERPMHGYQIINEIEERSHGSWKPSAGSVYPALQLLADEGLVSAEESNGRKIYSLTEAGREEVAGADASTLWDSTGPATSTGFTALPKAGVELAQAASLVGRTGSAKQVQEAVTVLDEARRRLYAILARD